METQNRAKNDPREHSGPDGDFGDVSVDKPKPEVDYSETNNPPHNSERTRPIERRRKTVEEQAPVRQEEIETKREVAEEQKRKESEERKNQADFLKQCELLNDVYALRPLRTDVSGEVRSVDFKAEEFAALWPHREFFELRYVSLVPEGRIIANSIGSHEIKILSQQSAFFHFLLDQQGLQGNWLNSENRLKDDYRCLNGLLLGKLNLVRRSDQNVVKSIALFEPVEAPALSGSSGIFPLGDLPLDFTGLGLSEKNLQLVDVKAYRTTYNWTSLGNDSLLFDVGEDDCAQIRLKPLLVEPEQEDAPPGIAIEIEEISRHSSELTRLLKLTGTPFENVEDKVKQATKATNIVKSQRTKIGREITQNNNALARASRNVVSLTGRLSYATKKEIPTLTAQLSRQRAIVYDCRAADTDLTYDLNRVEARYKDYLSRLKVYKDYLALLEKSKKIYSSETFTFSVAFIGSPDDEDCLTVVRLQPPDSSVCRDVEFSEASDKETSSDNVLDDDDEDAENGDEEKNDDP